MTGNYRVNLEIRAREVRLIDDQGNNLGIVKIKEALSLAKEKNLDLVEIAPNANPPVCRILDYGQWLYRQKKKEKESQKHQKTIDIKEVKFSLRISDNDFMVKRRLMERFLKEGHKVKVTIRLRGRERAHMELTQQMMNRIYESVLELATVERPLQSDGRGLSAVLAPKKS